jgi:hypothetical protein
MAAWSFAGGKLLLDLASGQYHGLGGADALVWSLLDGERGMRELVEELRRRSGDPAADVESELVRRLERLRRRGLVVG